MQNANTTIDSVTATALVALATRLNPLWRLGAAAALRLAGVL